MDSGLQWSNYKKRAPETGEIKVQRTARRPQN